MKDEKVMVKSIVLEDGIEYYVLTEIMVDENKYFYLVNVNDEKDICVRKQEIENGIEYLVTLDSTEELSKVLEKYKEKYIK